MGKIFSIVAILLFTINNCIAVELELSDVITQAREAAKLEKKHTEEQIKSVSDVSNENADNKQELISKENETK